MRATAAERTRSVDTPKLILRCVAAWLVPGAAHLWLRRAPKGVVFLVVLPLMFLAGLWLDGRIFPFEPAQPLVALAAVAELAAGWPYFLARAAGYGAGNVVSATYEYGNSYMIVAGLLNSLVIIDAFDIAMGRK